MFDDLVVLYQERNRALARAGEDDEAAVDADTFLEALAGLPASAVTTAGSGG